MDTPSLLGVGGLRAYNELKVAGFWERFAKAASSDRALKTESSDLNTMFSVINMDNFQT